MTRLRFPRVTYMIARRLDVGLGYEWWSDDYKALREAQRELDYEYGNDPLFFIIKTTHERVPTKKRKP